jgi:hypothetical protein
MKRSTPAAGIGAVGVALIVIALATRLFTVAPASERLTDNFRPEMRQAELGQLRQDINGLSAAQSEFTTKVVPHLAAALHLTPQQLGATLGQQYPAVSAGMQNVPAVSDKFNSVLDLLDQERVRFERADAIPTTSLPATTVPWALAASGAVCLAVAFLASRRWGGVAAVALGLLLIAGPLVLSLPGKADSADTMNSHLKPVYNAELVASAKQSLAGVQSMATELQTKLLAGLGGMLRMQPAQLQSYLAANFPALAAATESMPAALDRFERLVGAFDRSLGDYNTAKETRLVPIVWLLMLAGLVVAGAGGWLVLEGAAGPASERTAPVEAPAV